MRLDRKVSASVDVISGVSLAAVLRPLLFILYISDLFHNVGNHIVDYANDTTIYAVIIRQFRVCK